MMLALAPLALAGPIFLDAGELTYLDANGNWPRAFPTDDGWHLFYATEGEFWYQTMSDDLVTEFDERRELTGHRDLQDHAISLCPDGTFLHFATASVVENDDSLYSFVYDAQANLLSENELAYGDTNGKYVDVPSVCGETFRGTAYWADSVGEPFRYVEVDATGAEVRRVDLDDAPGALGSSMLEDEGHLFAIGVGSKSDDDGVLVSEYDAELEALEYVTVDLSEDPWQTSWTQGATRVGNVYLVIHIGQDTTQSWTPSEGSGDLWIEAFDLNWEPIDQMQLTAIPPGDGGMQPGLAVKGDRVLGLFSIAQDNVVVPVTIDLDAAESWDDPRGGDDTDLPADEDNPAPVDPTRECGCASGAAPAWLGLLGVLATRRRRS
ncbi:MAG: hypothetical protein ACOZNI_13980 [Myxococcota bacterium]